MAERYEDLPPVDSDGWLADQGRSFLDRTSRRISNLGLPDFLRSTQQKIQGLGEPVGQLYGNLEQGLGGLADSARTATSNVVTGLEDYGQDRIDALGQGVDALGQGLEDLRNYRPVEPPPGPPRSPAQELGDTLGQGLGEIGGQVGSDWQDLTDRMGTQLAGRYPRIAALGRGAGTGRLDGMDPDTLGQSFQGAGQGLADLGGAITDTTGDLAADPTLDPNARGAMQSATQRMRETGADLSQGGSKLQGGLAAVRRNADRGDLLGTVGETAGLLGNAATTALTATGAPLNAIGGGLVGGAVGGEHNLAEETGLNRALGERGLPGIQPDALVLGGLSNPAAAGGFAAQLATPATLIEDLGGLLLKQGWARVTQPLLRRFLDEVGQETAYRLMRRDPEGLGRLFDEWVQRTAQAGERLATEETGGGPVPRLPGVPEPVRRLGQRLSRLGAPPEIDAAAREGRLLAPRAGTVEDDWERGLAAMRAGDRTPVAPAAPAEDSLLRTFGSKRAAFRQYWTDEGARLQDVQDAVEGLVGKLPSGANVNLLRRLYAGREGATEALIEDELLPIVKGFSRERMDDLEQLLKMEDDWDKANAVASRVERDALGKPIGPVAGETELRGARQSERLRRQQLADAIQRQLDAEEAAQVVEQDFRSAQRSARSRSSRLTDEDLQRLRDDRERAKTVRYAARRQAREAANRAGITLSGLTRADLRRMRLDQLVETGKIAKETAQAEGAAVQGAETLAQRQHAGGVAAHPPEEIERALRGSVTRRLTDRLAPVGRAPTANEVEAEVRPIREAATRLQGFSAKLRDRLHDAGVFDDELVANWRLNFPHYIKAQLLNRLEEEAGTAVPAGANRFSVSSLESGGVNLGGRLSERGSEALRERPVSTLVRMAYATETVARRNEIAQALESLVREDPTGELAHTFRRLTPDERVRPGEIAFALRKDGAPVRYAVPKEYEALFQFDQDTARKTLGNVGKYLGVGALKAGATTYNPAFIALNAIRDAQVYLRRAVDRPGDLGGALKDLGGAYKDLWTTGGRGPADWREALRAGAGQSAAYSSRNPQQVRDLLMKEGAALQGRVRYVRRPQDLVPAFKDAVGAALDPVRTWGELVESAPRLAAYRRALRAGASREEAALAARDITLDFSRGGSQARAFNQLIPFLNAAVQGNARFAEDWAKRPAQTAAAALSTVVLPSVALEVYNRQFGPDYADVPSYLKDSGLVVMVPDQLGGRPRPERRADGTTVPGQRSFLYLPLAQDMAILRGAGLRALEAATGEDPGGWASVARSLGVNLSPVPLEGGVPLPPAARVAEELATNRDVFRGRDIVPEYVQGRPQGQQATEQTSAFGRVVGGAINKPPAAIDYAVEGLLGGLGRQTLLRGSDLAARAVGRGDLAAQPYSQGQGIDPLDVARGVPVAGDVVGRFLRTGGGQTEQYATDRLNTEREAALRAADARLNRMPSYRKLPPARQQQLRDQEYDKINREFQQRAKAERDRRSTRRVAAQRR